MKLLKLNLIFCFLIFLILNFHESSSISNTSSGEEVGLYDVFEIEVINSNSYSNPFDFIEIELQATFTSPTGKTIDFFGFYDGDGNGGQTGNVWKLRFMPDELGTWMYTYTWTDGTPGGSGNFKAIPSDIKGPIRANPDNPRWFQHANGDAFFFMGDWIWAGIKTRSDTRLQDLANFLESKGFSHVQWNFMGLDPGSHWGFAEPPIWVTSGSSIDFNRINLSMAHKADLFIKILAQKGIIAGLWLIGPSNYQIAPPAGSMRDFYFKYIASRYYPFWNVMLNITSEWEEGYDEDSAKITVIGNMIKDIDPFDRMLSVHPRAKETWTWGNPGWADYVTLQSRNGSTDAITFNSIILNNNQYDMPVWLSEGLWSEYQGPEARRKGAWAIVMAGGHFSYDEWWFLRRSGTTRWVEDDPNKWTSEFSGGTDIALAQGWFKILSDFFIMKVRFERMKPKSNLISGNTNAFCLANPGTEYVVYLASGESVNVDLSAASGSMSVEWLNPRTGEYTSSAPVTGGSKITFIAEDSYDWVLHIGGVSQVDKIPPSPPTGLRVE